MRFDRPSLQDLTQRLKRAQSCSVEHETPLKDCRGAPRQAAVLLTLFLHDEQWRLLFIRRAENPLDRHSGEVAFPGGRVEACDAHAEATALREAEEEIALSANRVDILGQLPALMTSSNYLVTPVVGRIGKPEGLLADPKEVAHIFSIPLTWLANPDNHQVRPWQPRSCDEPRQVIFFRPYQGERLWGISARITLNLVRALNASL